MDKVILLGIYDFLGFGTCLKLLEDGVQVHGFRFIKEENEKFIDEKKFMIGRNANFEEGSLEEFSPLLETDDGDVVILLSFYDLFYLYKEDAFSLQKFSLYDFIKRFQNRSFIKLVCLFPYEYLDGIPSVFQQQINSLENENIRIQSIFLPTIYGPWQPDTFLFQQCFIKDHLDIQLKHDQREITTDAIYIDDVVEEIIQLMQSSEMEPLLLQSQEEGNWQMCADFLKIDSMNVKIEPRIENYQQNYQIRKVIGKTPFNDGLTKQKQQFLRLINMSN